MKPSRPMHVIGYPQSLNYAVREPGMPVERPDQAVALTGAEKPQFK